MHERHARILGECRNLIAERGHADFAINDVAKLAGVSKRMIFNRYKTRDRLIEAAIVSDFYAGTASCPSDLGGTLDFGCLHFEHFIAAYRPRRRYLQEVLGMYFGNGLTGDAWKALHEATKVPLRSALRIVGDFSSIDMHAIDIWADDIVRLTYSAAYAWSAARIDDRQIEARTCLNFLIYCGGIMPTSAKPALSRRIARYAHRIR